MTSRIPKLRPVPRESLSARIEALEIPQAKSYAEFIRKGEASGPVPCWGAIAERFEESFARDDERKAVWTALVEEGDRRPLLLFLHANRKRPGVLAQVLEDAHRLPPSIQRILVSLPELASEIPAHLDKLAPAARQLFEAGPVALAREREMMEARVAQLTAFRYYVPDAFDPAHEPAEAKTDVPIPDTPSVDVPGPGTPTVDVTGPGTLPQPDRLPNGPTRGTP